MMDEDDDFPEPPLTQDEWDDRYDNLPSVRRAKGEPSPALLLSSLMRREGVLFTEERADPQSEQAA